MSQKEQKPSLQGDRIRTRKRDEKEKYDPYKFRDSILQGLNEVGTDLQQVAIYLDNAGSTLKYPIYSETLLDILFAGGIIAPGGTVVEDSDKTKVCRSEVCVFKTEDNVEAMYEFSEVFKRLTVRYKIFIRALENEIEKIVHCLHAFSEEERRKVAMFIAILFSRIKITAKCLSSLFKEQLVKDGIALQFSIDMFRVWLTQKDMAAISSVLVKAQLDDRLLELMPPSSRNETNFEKTFNDAGLEDIANYQRKRAFTESKKALYKELTEMIQESEDIKEMENAILTSMKTTGFKGENIIGVVWKVVMNSNEWSKNEQHIPEQIGNCFKKYMPLFKTFVTTSATEKELLLKIQEYCYSTSIMKVRKMFSTMVRWFYNADVISEDEILKWYKRNDNPKQKVQFNEQMEKFVEWLRHAEEESDDEEEDEEEEEEEK